MKRKAGLWGDPDWRAQHWGARRGIPWTKHAHDKALAMRAAGDDNETIAAAIERSVQSVEGKIGYQRRRAA